ncbi:uncharacterized protein LOC126839338 [Adelges cooleyi]|uniref:uncharacterized protein LOC126839338 n=1 Tax=Adelges cooleyi TaxID=133065 RepID=UPI00217F34F9|nr:uncharacterized protein LOC126839338 [Adelges cooleyi]
MVWLTAVALAAAVVTCSSFDSDSYDYRSNITWIRLCTITSNGSVNAHVKMPCGILVEGDKNSGLQKVLTTISVNPLQVHPEATDPKRPATTTQLPDRINYTETNTSRVDLNVEEDPEADDERTDSDENDLTIESVDDDDDEQQDEPVVVDQKVLYTGNQTEDDDAVVLVEQHQRGTAATAIFEYLRSARALFFNRIQRVLKQLEFIFFNSGGFSNSGRRNRRNAIRKTLFNMQRIQERAKKNSASSMITQPSFERSLMTMSFLMFGVFVIQVIQRLMKTFNRSGTAQ